MVFKPEVLIIGASVIDIPLCPVSADVFDVGSYPLSHISMHLGGDAANESVILSRLGHKVMLSSNVGTDGAGDFILNALRAEGVRTDYVLREVGRDTAINIVLIREDGERSFITNKNGSLRRLMPDYVHIALQSDRFNDVKIVCLASLFVSPLLTTENTEPLFAEIKRRGKLLCADTTRRKNGETVQDIAPLLKHLDYFFPNEEEARLLTGKTDLDAIADDFLSCGTKNVAIKLGKRGCFIKSARERAIIPAYPDAHCVDTTGAGDTFAAAFLASLLEGRTFRECAVYANAAASVCVESLGATSGLREPQEIERRFRHMLSLSE